MSVLKHTIYKISCCVLIGYWICCFNSFAQPQRKEYKICFYNVENFFDCVDDTLTEDNDFTPLGAYHWSRKKFDKKKADIAKTLLAIGQSDPPAIVGLCEIENSYVLNALCKDSPLRSYGYRFIHHDSKDRRGVDVAMLYRPDLFYVFNQKNIQINLSVSHEHTRDILYVGGILGTDTLHCFVCHFPSKRGGKQATGFRKEVALTLQKNIDSICRSKDARIIVMGDFNAPPKESYFSLSLEKRQNNEENHLELVNLMHGCKQQGSYFFQGKWEWIDHFIVSKNMLSDQKGLRVKDNSVRAATQKFLLEYNAKHLAFIPFRTYRGPIYHGGISDHLPIVLELIR